MLLKTVKISIIVPAITNTTNLTDHDNLEVTLFKLHDSSLQPGFRSGHSCGRQLVITMHDLMKSFDRKLQTYLILLVFSKAFDMVPHRKLLHKLQNYGIRGNTLRWLSSILTTRNQQVIIWRCHIIPMHGRIWTTPGHGHIWPLLFMCHIRGRL